MAEFVCVVAIGPSGQIGEKNELPWPPGSIRGDMNYFKNLTLSLISYDLNGSASSCVPSSDMGNVVIMGRKTWDSIPSKFRPLENRLNIIITSSVIDNCDQNVCVAPSFATALEKATEHVSKSNGQVFVVGGASIYNLAIDHSNCKGIFVTEISGPVKKGDVFFPIEKLRTSRTRNLINQLGYSLIKDYVKSLKFEDDYFFEKNFKYQFTFYH